MKKPNINLKRKINFEGKIIVLFLIGLLLGFASGSGLIIVFGQERNESLVVKKDNEVTKSGEILGVFELPSPTPSPTLTLAPTPTPTNSTSTPESANSSPPIDTASSTSTYSGPPLSPPSEKKELLIISDSLPEGWIVEKEEKIAFVSGKVGQALKVEEGGSLVLSGGEIFANSGTLSFWLKIETTSVSDEAPIIDWNFGGEAYVSQSLFEIASAGDWLAFNLYDAMGSQNDIVGDLGAPLEWHYVVVTWDITSTPFRRVLYIDGTKVGETGFLFAPETRHDSVFQIGGMIGTGRSPIPFAIDELVLTNWAKSEEEIVMIE